MWNDFADPWFPPALVVAYAALLGAVLGSFLNVCILRWGAEPKQSVMRPRSRCPSCGHTIRWYENIPIVSWLLLRGRCSECGARISPMYPAVEAAAALIWGGSVALLGPGIPALRLAVAATLLLGIAVSDARAYIIPHEFSLGGTAVALALAAWPGPPAVPDAIIGALFGAGVVLLTGELTELALGQEAMGGGDCALMGMVGAFFGWEAVWPVLGLGALIGLVVHLGLAGVRRRHAPVTDPTGDPAAAPTGAGSATVPEAGSGLRWRKLLTLLGLGIIPLALLVLAARAGALGPVLRALFYAVLGAGAAYYASFLAPRRVLRRPVTQVWGLIGAALGVAVGTRHWLGILTGAGLAAGALAWSARREVAASPATTEELSAQGYLPFGVGLSIAAGVLAFAGTFDRVRRVFAEVALGLGLS